MPGAYGSSVETIWHVVSCDADYLRSIPDTPKVAQVGQEVLRRLRPPVQPGAASAGPARSASVMDRRILV